MLFWTRDYQSRYINTIRSAVRAYMHDVDPRMRRVCVVSPTGSGKTVIHADIVRQALMKSDNDRRIIWSVHRDELLDQASKTLLRLGVRHGVARKRDPLYRPSERVQIVSARTYEPTGDELLAVLDECHRAEHRRVIDQLRCVTLGPSATPQRLDGQGLAPWYGHMIEEVTIGQLLSDGWLTPYIYKIGERCDGRRRDDPDAAAESVIVGDVVDFWHEFAPNTRTLGFDCTIAQAAEITERFRRSGVSCEYTWGSDKDRRRKMEAHKRGDFLMMRSVNIFTEGYDDQELQTVHITRPTNSLSLDRQFCGRPLRVPPGVVDPPKITRELIDRYAAMTAGDRRSAIANSHKPHCWILDQGDNGYIHGAPDEPYKWTLNNTRTRRRKLIATDDVQYRPADCCLKLTQVNATICPWCGASPVWKQHTQKRMREVAAVGIDLKSAPKRKEKPPKTEQEKRAWRTIWTGDEQTARATLEQLARQQKRTQTWVDRMMQWRDKKLAARRLRRGKASATRSG